MDKPHHHGNLRAALIAAGLDLLESEGVEGLTLRKAAACAGVSHAAPAHHFDGKFGLILAIAADGFRLFTETLSQDRYRAGDSPQQQLLGICNGYLRFATEHNALFRLIFSTEIKTNPDPALQAESGRAFGVLQEVCALFEPSPNGPGVNEIQIWALVHGYAMLRNFTHLANPLTGEPIAFDSILPPMRVRT